jgi:hypothetical protein
MFHMTFPAITVELSILHSASQAPDPGKPVRRRFWFELVLAIVTGVLFVVTLSGSNGWKLSDSTRTKGPARPSGSSSARCCWRA